MMKKKIIKEKPISRKEARAIASRIIASLAYYDAEAAENFSDLVPRNRGCDIGLIEGEFYKIIARLDGDLIIKK